MSTVREDYIVSIESCGKKRKLYKYSCPNCKKDMGYKRKSYNKLCRRCTHINIANKRLQQCRSKYPNVNFDDYIDKPFKKSKSRGSGFKREYRTTCKWCGTDKGYVRKTLFSTRCYKCTMTISRKIDISCRQRGVPSKEFNGFVTPENVKIRQSKEGRKWREEVLKKYSFTCDTCKKKGGTLHAHHLYSFDTHINKRFDLSNGVCLCETCHTQFHIEHGKGVNTEEQYLLFKSAYSLR